jgi:hypothetical protein
LLDVANPDEKLLYEVFFVCKCLQIREITGYVLIVTVYAEKIPLTNLRVIRGWTQYRHKDDRSLSLAIISNYDPNGGVGLRELQLPSLHGNFEVILRVCA